MITCNLICLCSLIICFQVENYIYRRVCIRNIQNTEYPEYVGDIVTSILGITKITFTRSTCGGRGQIKVDHYIMSFSYRKLLILV